MQTTKKDTAESKIHKRRFSPENEKAFIKELKEELKYIGMTANDFSKSIFITEAKGKSIFRYDSFFSEEDLTIINKRFGVKLKN